MKVFACVAHKNSVSGPARAHVIAGICKRRIMYIMYSFVYRGAKLCIIFDFICGLRKHKYKAFR